ncbi:MarR family winged helix-turn-helix transcriptional regulator [uncultured Ramlibacter sp.]|uniref:MarR family winged helix-turn-helix transcriptional regulator n=1 Tax=uncultured Ramlibacter sp. TaxID=260755 RepID=UPI0026164592|nr:MarR family winged helix-turn-helix transcriptional regulator [uncultured Ramlibacter sp.]
MEPNTDLLAPSNGGPTQAAGDSGAQLLGRHPLDAFTHARLWRNPCGFSARFNYLSLRYNTPLYGWVEQEFGLSRPEFVVVYCLGIMDGVTASEIANSTAFPKNTLSRAVNRIAKLGLIRRMEGATDRRQQKLSLTPKGRAVLDKAMPRFRALEAEMLAPLSLVEQETLSALMAKVVLAMFDGAVDDRASANPAPTS